MSICVSICVSVCVSICMSIQTWLTISWVIRVEVVVPSPALLSDFDATSKDDNDDINDNDDNDDNDDNVMIIIIIMIMMLTLDQLSSDVHLRIFKDDISCDSYTIIDNFWSTITSFQHNITTFGTKSNLA